MGFKIFQRAPNLLDDSAWKPTMRPITACAREYVCRSCRVFRVFGVSQRPITSPPFRAGGVVFSATASKSQQYRSFEPEPVTTLVRVQGHCVVCLCRDSDRQVFSPENLPKSGAKATCSFHMLDAKSNHTTLRRSIPLRILGILST